MRIVYFILLLLWFFIGCLICKNTFCGTDAGTREAAAAGAVSAAATDCETKLIFKDGDLDLTSEQNFVFSMSSGKVVQPSENLQEIINTTAEYLKANPNRFVEITGIFGNKEKNNTAEDNLGIARAKSVDNLLILAGTPKKQTNIKGSKSDNICFKDNHVQNAISLAFGEIK